MGLYSAARAWAAWRYYKLINLTNIWYYSMILCIMEIVSHISIICMILKYDTTHYG
jgi:hypothetical protein